MSNIDTAKHIVSQSYSRKASMNRLDAEKLVTNISTALHIAYCKGVSDSAEQVYLGFKQGLMDRIIGLMK